VNSYTLMFFSRCPLNGSRIEYTWKIENPANCNALLVEDLIDAVGLLDRGMHEEIADTLFREFGGKQTLTANHHGVQIETVRP
jgi:hypothetical protein